MTVRLEPDRCNAASHRPYIPTPACCPSAIAGFASGHSSASHSPGHVDPPLGDQVITGQRLYACRPSPVNARPGHGIASPGRTRQVSLQYPASQMPIRDILPVNLPVPQRVPPKGVGYAHLAIRVGDRPLAKSGGGRRC
jgi:hypothetical protein